MFKRGTCLTWLESGGLENLAPQNKELLLIAIPHTGFSFPFEMERGVEKILQPPHPSTSFSNRVSHRTAPVVSCRKQQRE